MSDRPAAIQASFADFRLIKGRKTAQIILEIPIEGADAALAALGGIPQPHSERWVGVARLNGSTQPPEPEPKPQFPFTNCTVWVDGENSYQYQNGNWVPNSPTQKGQYPNHINRPEPEENTTKLSLQAVMRCKEPLFWRFLNTQTVQPVEDETDAAWVVRQLCGVESRSGLNTDPNAAALWRILDAKFLVWKRGME
jgi:hypothetical protein